MSSESAAPHAISGPSDPWSRFKRWPIVLIVAFSLASCVYLFRDPFERIVVAISVYRAHIFTPPQPLPGESRFSRFREHAEFYSDFARFIVAREKRLKKFDPVLKPLVKEIGRRQASGEGMQYSMHIYREIRWRLNFTPDVDATQARIADLRESLTQPEKQKLAAEQQASDGSWALGINVWYLTLYYSVEDGLDNGIVSQYPLSFLDRVNSPEKMTAQLNSDLYDNLSQTGVFNREELDETFSAMARLLFKMKPSGYAFDPGLPGALTAFVAGWQNPVTGCWGQWIVDRQGRVWKMDDMGITFHVVSDLKGNVPHLDLIAKRLLQLDGVNFPAGILFDGHYENHLNWDAVKIFRYAWPYLDDPTRKQVQSEISRMLDWCLTKSLQPDGSFKVSDLDDTVGDAYDYGVYFLRETGYFRREDRFWTDQDFPDAKSVHDRIEAKIKSMGLNDSGLKQAYEALQALD
jgi:hypothetical protein